MSENVEKKEEIKKNTTTIANEKVKTNKTRKRTIIVLIVAILALLVGYVYLRGSYLEVKSIGENYLTAF